jgi:hypothetical protein
VQPTPPGRRRPARRTTPHARPASCLRAAHARAGPSQQLVLQPKRKCEQKKRNKQVKGIPHYPSSVTRYQSIGEHHTPSFCLLLSRPADELGRGDTPQASGWLCRSNWRATVERLQAFSQHPAHHHRRRWSCGPASNPNGTDSVPFLRVWMQSTRTRPAFVFRARSESPKATTSRGTSSFAMESTQGVGGTGRGRATRGPGRRRRRHLTVAAQWPRHTYPGPREEGNRSGDKKNVRSRQQRRRRRRSGSIMPSPPPQLRIKSIRRSLPERARKKFCF